VYIFLFFVSMCFGQMHSSERSSVIDRFPGAEFISRQLSQIYRSTGSTVGHRETLRKEYPGESAAYDAYMRAVIQRNRSPKKCVKSLHSVAGKTVEKSGDLTERAQEIAHDVESPDYFATMVREDDIVEDDDVESVPKIDPKGMPFQGKYNPLRYRDYRLWALEFPKEHAHYLERVKARRDRIKNDPELREIEQQKKRARTQL
jgi:hypothetical protein